jgi:hypothetical protein
VAPIARLAAALGIPWFAITDDDKRPDGSTEPVAQRARADLAALATPCDRSVIMAGKLEGVLSLRRHGDTLEIITSLDPLTEEDIRSRFPIFAAICNEIIAWCKART